MRTYINMKKIELALCLAAVSALCSHEASAQYRTGPAQADSLVQQTLSVADTASVPVVITLEQALQIALSENIPVKVADQEIQRTTYARKGTYASLFPQIDLSGTYQRTIKKQVMYMDFDMGTAGGGSSEGDGTGSGEGLTMPDTSEGLEVGRWNTWAAGLNATMPLVNPQLWKSLRISGLEVEMAIEKARSSRLDMVTQVKQAFYGTLLAKEAFQVYKDVYENALDNLHETEKKFKSQKAEIERKSDVIQTLILLPICRVYYESNKQYGYYKQYKYIHHDRVRVGRAFHVVYRGIYPDFAGGFDESDDFLRVVLQGIVVHSLQSIHQQRTQFPRFHCFSVSQR